MKSNSASQYQLLLTTKTDFIFKTWKVCKNFKYPKIAKVTKNNYSAVARSGVQWNTRPFLPPPPTLPWGASQYKMVGIKTILIIDLKYHLNMKIISGNLITAHAMLAYIGEGIPQSLSSLPPLTCKRACR